MEVMLFYLYVIYWWLLLKKIGKRTSYLICFYCSYVVVIYRVGEVFRYRVDFGRYWMEELLVMDIWDLNFILKI